MRQLGDEAGEHSSGDRQSGSQTIGQLSESWQYLKNLLHNPDRAVGHHLVWLADVFRVIG
ncbi:hypothetical protein [Streptomyces sp. NPDC012888]|uniref:hypothetical protein n=1 Tax=Streptomyces sp. NPDC012888 TaxID=3364855 RepID=UPI0036A13F6A